MFADIESEYKNLKAISLLFKFQHGFGVNIFGNTTALYIELPPNDFSKRLSW